MSSPSIEPSKPIAPQTVVLPNVYANYLRSKAVSSNLQGYWTGSHYRFFDSIIPLPGIKIIRVGEDEIEVSINQHTLPHYCKSTQDQAIILSALQSLEVISGRANAIEADVQQDMAQSIHEALKNYLQLNNSNFIESNLDKILPLLRSIHAATLLASTVTMGAMLLLFSGIITTALFATVAFLAGVIILSSVVAFTAISIIEGIVDTLARKSALTQAITACEKLAAEVTQVNEKIAVPSVSDERAQTPVNDGPSTSTAAANSPIDDPSQVDEAQQSSSYSK